MNEDIKLKIQKICNEHEITCGEDLWQNDRINIKTTEILDEILEEVFGRRYIIKFNK